MGFIPSRALAAVLAETQTGLWIEALQEGRVGLVCKVPETVIKALYRGARCSFLLSVIQVENLSILCLGLRVEDEPENPFTVVAPLLSSRDPDNPWRDLDQLKELLAARSATLHCLNELSHPLLSASCSFEPEAAQAALDGLNAARPFVLTPTSYALIPSSGDSPQPSDALRLLEEALRRFQKHIYGAGNDAVVMTASLAITSTIWTPQEVFEVNEALQAGPFLLSDAEEGRKQEKAVYLIMSAVYPGSTYISPTVRDGSSTREFIDVFAFDGSWVCLLESKALALLTVAMDRSTERRASLVAKHVTKALGQLRGALSKLRSGDQVYDADNRPIAIANQAASPAHAIVLLSEMYAFLDWRQIAREVVKASEDERRRALFHVVDLLELTYLVGQSKDAHAFNNYMAQRWLAVKTKGTAYLRSKRMPGTPSSDCSHDATD